jgi:hypothetical protein
MRSDKLNSRTRATLSESESCGPLRATCVFPAAFRRLASAAGLGPLLRAGSTGFATGTRGEHPEQRIRAAMFGPTARHRNSHLLLPGVRLEA